MTAWLQTLKPEQQERLLALVQTAGQFLLLAAMALGLADLFWLVAGQSRAPLPPLPAAAQRPVATTAPTDTGRLAQLALFGRQAAAPTDSALNSNAPPTSQPLELRGVFLSGEAKRSSAIIAEQGRPDAQLYRVDDALPGGGRLQAVLADKVLLRRADGRSEALLFPKPASLLNAPPGYPAAGSSPRQTLTQYAEAFRNRPNDFLADMGLMAGPDGYRVPEGGGIHPNLARSGLQPGDRIARINGQVVGDPNRDRQLLDQIQSAPAIQVEVHRGAQTLTITMPLTNNDRN